MGERFARRLYHYNPTTKEEPKDRRKEGEISSEYKRWNRNRLRLMHEAVQKKISLLPQILGMERES
jgi:hypothetical protein